MKLNQAIALPALIILAAGCGSPVTPGSDRITEERIYTVTNSTRSLVLSEPLDWYSSQATERYDVWLPQGSYRLEAEDGDYWYYRAPAQITLGKKSVFSGQDMHAFAGGLYISKTKSSKTHPAGAYINEYPNNKMLLVYVFDKRFIGQEGKRWHYARE